MTGQGVAGVAIALGCAVAYALTAGCAPDRGAPPAAQYQVPAGETLQPVVLPDLSLLAASVQRQLRERDAALTHTLEDRTTSPVDRAAAYGGLGRLLMAVKFSDEAAACYRHAEALVPDDMRWPYYLGHVYLMAGDRGRAAAAFERASTLQPADVPALVWLAETYLDDGRLDAAQSAFLRALSLQPQSAATLFGAGRAALARRAYPEAVQYFERTLAVDGRASAVHYPLAMAYRALGDRVKAEAHLRERGDAWPDLIDPLRQADDEVLDSPVAFEHRGVQALKSQDWTAAAAAFRKGLELQPDDPALRYWLGAALYTAGDTAGAEREFEAVVRTSPDFAKAYFSLGAIFDATGRRAAAIEQFSAAVKYDPTMTDGRVRLGDALRAAGRSQEALAQYQEAVKLDPGSAAGWVGGARVLLGLERYEEARQWLTLARRVHPALSELGELQARLPPVKP